MSSTLKKISAKGHLKIVQQEGGYCHCGILVDDEPLDIIILDYAQRDFGPMVDTINLGTVEITIAFKPNGK